MMKLALTLVLFAFWRSYVVCNEVQLITKKSAVKGGPITLSDGESCVTDTYADFLEKSKVVVDKSLFINKVVIQLIQSRGAHVVTAPARWGKSVLLKMIEYFFSPELDEDGKKIDTLNTMAYNFFMNGKVTVKNEERIYTPSPLISSFKTDAKILHYISNYSTIHLDFKNFYQPGNTKEEVVTNYLKIVHIHVMSKHKVVINKLCNGSHSVDAYGNTLNITAAHLSKACNMLGKFLQDPNQVSSAEVAVLMPGLISVLHSFYKNHVIILIDNYETLFYNLYIFSGRQESPIELSTLTEIRSVFESIVSPLVKSVDKEKDRSCHCIVLMMGMVSITFKGISTQNGNRFTNYMNPLVNPFFVMNNNVGTQLLEWTGSSETNTKAFDVSFGGYEMPNALGTSVMNPWSFLVAVRDNKESTLPWLPIVSTTISSIRKTIRENEFARRDVLALFAGQCLKFKYQPYGVRYGFEDLKKIGLTPFAESKLPNTRNFLLYMMQIGFLSITNRLRHRENEIVQWPSIIYPAENITEKDMCVRIPNVETHLLVHSAIEDLNINHHDLFETSETLAKMLSDHSFSSEQFIKKLETLLKDNRTQIIHGFGLFRHDVLLAEVAFVLKKTYGYNNVVSYNLGNKNILTPNIAMCNGTHGGVFEVKYNASKSEWNKVVDVQLPAYGKLFHDVYPEVKFLRLMAVHIEDDSKDNDGGVKVIMVENCTSTESEFKKLNDIYQNLLQNKEIEDIPTTTEKVIINPNVNDTKR